MKTKHTLSMVLLAIGSLLGFSGRREDVCNEASTVGTHANGIIPLSAEANITTRYLLVQKGGADNGCIVNVLATRPLGVCLDEPASGSKAAVALLGCAPGTLKMRANGAIAVGALVYTAAGGKISGTFSTTAYLVGRALTPAAADGDLVEVAHCLPLVSGTAL
jgi:hypothetical protein